MSLYICSSIHLTCSGLSIFRLIFNRMRVAGVPRWHAQVADFFATVDVAPSNVMAAIDSNSVCLTVSDRDS